MVPSFLHGFIEGISCPQLSKVEDLLVNLVSEMSSLKSGDFTVLMKIVEDWGVLESAIDAVQFP